VFLNTSFKMNFIVVFSLIASAFADKALHEAGINKALESLEQTVFQGSGYHSGLALGQKLYVQQMLRNSLKSPDLAFAADAFKSAKMKLQDILATMSSQTGADQATLDEIKMAFEHCTDAWEVSTGHGAFVTDHNDAVSHTSRAHVECRIQEQGLITTANTDCGVMAANAVARTTADTSDHPCASSITSSDLIGDVAHLLGTSEDHFYNSWDSWFNSQNSHFQDTALSGEATDCKTAYDAWHDKNGMGSYNAGSCGYLQLNYEQAFCARKIQLMIRCEQNEYCHDYYHNQYNATEKQVAGDEVQRLRDVAMVNYVICLFDELANGTGNATVEDIDSTCQNNLDGATEVAAYQAQYAVNRTAIPAPEHPNCATEPFNTDTDPTTSVAWHGVLLNLVAAGSDTVSGVTFVGPFRTATPGLCTTSPDYAARGPAYYIQVTDQSGNEYWHNESLVGATK